MATNQLHAREAEEVLHRYYIPKGSLARRSLPLSELIGRRKDAIYLQRHRVGRRVRAVLLQYKINEEAPQETEMGQNVL